MRRVAFRAADVVAPVIAAPEIIMFFLAGVTGQTGFGNFLRVFVFERNYFCFVAASFNVFLSRTMTGFAALYFVLPAGNSAEFAVFGAGYTLESIFVARLAGFASDILTWIRSWRGTYCFRVDC